MALKVLDVGGNNKKLQLPPFFAGWEHLLLDIRPGPDVDFVADARELQRLPAASFDGIFCSHNLEHYYEHDVPKVLAGFLHVLKPGSVVYLVVPDIQNVLTKMVQLRQEPDDVLYVSPVGPVRYCDVIFGFAREIASSGDDHYAHKIGFSPKLLDKTLQRAGYDWRMVRAVPENYEIHALAARQPLADWLAQAVNPPTSR